MYFNISVDVNVGLGTSTTVMSLNCEGDVWIFITQILHQN